MARGLKSPGEKGNGNPGCTSSWGEATNSRRLPATARTPTPSKREAVRIIVSIRASQGAWKPIGCAPVFSASRRTIFSSWEEWYSTSNELESFALIDSVICRESLQLAVHHREPVVIAAGPFPILHIERSSWWCAVNGNAAEG